MKNLLLIPALMFGCGVAATAATTTTNASAVYAATDAVESGTLEINMNNGSFTVTNATGTYATHWQSTQKAPTIEIDCGKNNIDTKASNTNGYLQAWIGNSGSCDYNIYVSEGWKITGYSMEATLANENNPVTVQTPDNKTYGITMTPTTINVENIDAQTTLFTLVGGNYGVNLANFVIRYEKDNSDKPQTITRTVFDNRNSLTPYRIPAIGVAQNGTLVAVADYRYNKADIGSGRVDLHLRLSNDNGETWGDELHPSIFEGDGDLYSATRHDKAAYGDPCIVGDRESGKMMIMSCSGYPNFQDTSDRHQGLARWYSDDNGQNWTGPEYLDEEFVYQPFDAANHHINGFFIGSGKIHQSHYIKKGEYYRLYCAGLSQQKNSNYENWVLYSDDFGKTWNFLGGLDKSPVPSGDEPKVEELPNGNILISSRTAQGRYYNIYTFTSNDGVTGTWGTKALSSSNVNGLTANNGCNGEILILPVIRKEDGQKTFIALQSLPVQDRTKVTIFYKDLTDASTYASPENFAANWDGRYQVSNTTSAYSTMCLQKDNTIGFLYEENGANSGYDIVYKRLNVETITSDKYAFNADYKYEQTEIDEDQAKRNEQLSELINEVETAVKANSTYSEGENLITSAEQLNCPWGCKEQKPENATDQNWTYDCYDISNLIDGNSSTYYHTVWQNGTVSAGSHWIDVTANENEKFEGTIKVYVTRRQNADDDHIKTFAITGTNDDVEFEDVAEVNMPNATKGAKSESEFSIAEGKSYSKLRFTVTATVTDRGYWHMAEFQLRPMTLDADCKNALYADAYAGILFALEDAKTHIGNATTDDIKALQTAFEAYEMEINTPIVDAINGVTTSTSNRLNTIYDLQGRRVEKMQKGVYIVNGKKFVK